MNDFKQLMQIDWWYVVLALLVLFICIKLVWNLLDWLFVEKLGVETKKMRQRRQESELLKTTTELAKTTAENLHIALKNILEMVLLIITLKSQWQ